MPFQGQTRHPGPSADLAEAAIVTDPGAALVANQMAEEHDRVTPVPGGAGQGRPGTVLTRAHWGPSPFCSLT